MRRISTTFNGINCPIYLKIAHFYKKYKNCQIKCLCSVSMTREKPKFSRIGIYPSKWLDEDSMYRDHISMHRASPTMNV